MEFDGRGIPFSMNILPDVFYISAGDVYPHKEVRQKPAPYLVEGIGEDMMPENMHLDVWDDVVQVTDRESFKMTREISTQEGLLVGPSSGTALVAAIKYAEKIKTPSTLLVMFPDSGRAYLSKAFNDEWLKEKGLV
jgi:cystathionine beta-synthase